MTNKERLEEVKKNVIVDKVYFKYLNNDKGYWGKSYTLIEEDMKWFVEQAERVQELERQNQQFKTNLSVVQGYYKTMVKINNDIAEENKRYRDALEFYAKERNWEDSWIITLNGQESDVPLAIDDCGYKARKALESDSDE